MNEILDFEVILTKENEHDYYDRTLGISVKVAIAMALVAIIIDYSMEQSGGFLSVYPDSPWHAHMVLSILNGMFFGVASFGCCQMILNFARREHWSVYREDIFPPSMAISLIQLFFSKENRRRAYAAYRYTQYSLLGFALSSYISYVILNWLHVTHDKFILLYPFIFLLPPQLVSAATRQECFTLMYVSSALLAVFLVLGSLVRRLLRLRQYVGIYPKTF